MPETFAQYLEKWLKQSTSQGLTNPLVKMPIKRFRELQPDEFGALEKGKTISLGTTSEPIARNLFKNFKARLRERGEHCAFVSYGCVEMTIAGALNQQTKSAVFPVALKRVNLENAKETIKAHVSEDAEWAINQVLAANLKSLNIHLKREAVLNPAELVQVLRVQLGNRAMRVGDTAYVGLFSNQQMVLQARLNEPLLRQSLAKNPLIAAKVAGERLTAPLSSEVTDDGIEELGLVLPCDDSQLRVVQLTNAGTCLQVEGPPGTGKSQTIANIISNALFHGRTALLVCDKKAAINQVEERLAGCGLKPAILNLHDEDLEKREFLKQATSRFEEEERSRVYPTTELAEARKTLNERVKFGRAVVHPALQVTRRDALSGMLQLKKELKTIPNLQIPNWNALSSQRVRKLIESMGEWTDLDPVLTEKTSIWNKAKPEAFDDNPNATNEVREIVEALALSIGSLEDLREVAATVGVEMPLSSHKEAGAIGELAEVVLSRPSCHAMLLGNRELSIKELEQLRSLFERRTKLVESEYPLSLETKLEPVFEAEAKDLVRSENAETWANLADRLAAHEIDIARLGRIDQEYRRLCNVVGLVPSEDLQIRQAQLRGILSLGFGTSTIPRAWWKATARPVHSIAEWKGHFQACANHIHRGVSPMNCLALERIRQSHWNHLEAKAEHGFNTVSYCLHFVNDRKCKYALRQVFTSIPAKGFKDWESLLLHAIAGDGILKVLRSTAETHPVLQQLTSAYLASAHEGVSPDLFTGHEEVGRLEATAQLVEQVRANTELYDTASSTWLAFWETPSAKALAEVESLLKELDILNLPVRQHFADSLKHLSDRKIRIVQFLDNAGAAGGDRKRGILENIAAIKEHAEINTKLKPLEKYLPLVASAEPDWKRMHELLSWRDRFERLQGPQKLDLENRLWLRLRDDLHAHIRTVETQIEALSAFFNGLDLAQKYPTVLTTLEEIVGQMPQHQLWLDKGRWSKKVSAYPEIGGLWGKILDGSVLTKNASKLFCYNLLRLCEPVLKSKGSEFTQTLRTFSTQDEKLESWTIEQLKARLRKRMAVASELHAQSESELRRLSGLQRIHGTVREILNNHINYVFEAKPCWMLSPTSLANLIDSSIFEEHPLPFDLIIFDEASQVRVMEGLLSMGFGKQVVIVGDKHQLPPTDFFAGFAGEVDDPQDLGTSESLLDEFSSVFETGKTQVMLMSHYRSETPDLIQFSNDWFYESKLEVLPPCHVTGIGRRLHYVSNAIYSEVSGQRNNPTEAREVLKLIQLHVREAGDKSLGVVTMNIAQMELIEELLQGSEDEDLKAFCSSEAKFFLRNLESVQGDEMDRIILSLTYGKNPEGHFNAAILGPLIKSGGERRLNVAITRSRSGLTIVSSLKSADLEASHAQSKGFLCLKKLIGDLEREQANRTFGLTSKRFTRKEDGVSNVIYCDSPFEMQVVEFLENHGLEVECQHGAGGFRIDIVVKENGRNLLAVECDGAAYHSSLVARTRDRARQRVLEKLGWRFHRIWSTNWWHYEDQEKEALLAAINQARTEVGRKKSSSRNNQLVLGAG